MPFDPAPATVVMLARVASGTTADEFATLDEVGRRRGAAITWVVGGDDLAAFTARCPEARTALALDAGATRSRQDLRKVLGGARAAAPELDGVVMAAETPIVHRDLLVDSGIRTAVVDRFDESPRGIRRPAPDGWPCRSIVWGLWEIESTVARAAGGIGRWMPWSGVPVAGSLTVIPVEGQDTRDLVDRLGRVIDRHTGSRRAARFASVAELPSMLGSVGQPRGGSVLRAA